MSLNSNAEMIGIGIWEFKSYLLYFYVIITLSDLIKHKLLPFSGILNFSQIVKIEESEKTLDQYEIT